MIWVTFHNFDFVGTEECNEIKFGLIKKKFSMQSG